MMFLYVFPVCGDFLPVNSKIRPFILSFYFTINLKSVLQHGTHNAYSKKRLLLF